MNHDHDHDPAHDFDERAATWDDDPAKAERARDIADAIRSRVELDPSMRVLEYGAGTGLLTQALRNDVGPVTLADTSAGMRQVIEDKIAAGLIPDARVWDVDLSTGPVPDERFDLVVSAMVLHHVPDTRALLASLAAMLEPGGHLCVADLDAEDGSFHGHGFEGHHGFDRQELSALLSQVGFVDVVVTDCGHVARESGEFSLFLATARTPA